MRPPCIVLSDLDGCLLDRRTYAWEAARPALDALRRLGIPLVLCSSKTRAEVEAHRAVLDGTHPFIVENGGAVFIPLGYFASRHPMARREGPYELLEFGVPYGRLTELFRELRSQTGLSLHGFSDMTVQEVAFFTGLETAPAERAKAREYDEPFLACLTAAQEAVLAREAAARGLTITRGGRFLHLTGDHSKGRAAEAVIGLYRSQWHGISSVGLGDGANDVSLLEVVDHAVVIPRDSGTVDPVFLRRRWPVAPAPGPEGWNAEILKVLEWLAGPGAEGSAEGARAATAAGPPAVAGPGGRAP